MRRGFTLTELLVVILVIGTLAGVAFPLANKVKKRAQGIACMSKLRNIGIGLEGYLSENNGVMPPLFLGRQSKDDDAEVLEVVLLPFLGGDEFAFRCPSDHEHFEKSGSSYFWNENLSGVHRMRLTLLGADADSSAIPLIFDKEAYHGERNGVNFLYADQSVSREINFKTSSRD